MAEQTKQDMHESTININIRRYKYQQSILEDIDEINIVINNKTNN